MALKHLLWRLSTRDAPLQVAISGTCRWAGCPMQEFTFVIRLARHDLKPPAAYCPLCRGELHILSGKVVP